MKGLYKIWITLGFLFSLLPGSPCFLLLCLSFLRRLSPIRLEKMKLSLDILARAKMSLLVQHKFL